MKRILAVGLSVLSVLGTFAVWRDLKSGDEDVQVNAKVDARLHQVLSGMLQAQRRQVLAQVRQQR